MKTSIHDNAAPAPPFRSEALTKPEGHKPAAARADAPQPPKPVGAMTYTVSNGADVWAFLRLGRS